MPVHRTPTTGYATFLYPLSGSILNASWYETCAPHFLPYRSDESFGIVAQYILQPEGIVLYKSGHGTEILLLSELHRTPCPFSDMRLQLIYGKAEYESSEIYPLCNISRYPFCP